MASSMHTSPVLHASALVLACFFILAISTLASPTPSPDTPNAPTPSGEPVPSPSSHAPTPAKEQATPVLYGIDLVALRSLPVNGSKPVFGVVEHSLKWQNYTFWFANQTNRAHFKADPERYAPAFGGFCAYAVAKFHKSVCVLADAWYIIDERVFLLCNAKVGKEEWLPNAAKYIHEGDVFWNTTYGGPFAGPFNTGAFCESHTFLDSVPAWVISLIILAIVTGVLVLALVVMRCRRGQPSYTAVQ